MGIRTISAGVLAIGLAAAAAPASADTIQSGNGAYTVSWDPAAQSTPLTVHQQIVVFDNSTFGFSSIDFDFATKDALVSNAPEPATWAMLIAGFGGIGALMRRRRALSFA